MTTESATTSTPQEVSPAQAAEFLLALFQPGDYVLIRPVESWTEGDRKRTKVDYRGVDYLLLGRKNNEGEWLADGNTDRLTRTLARIIERSKYDARQHMFRRLPTDWWRWAV